MRSIGKGVLGNNLGGIAVDLKGNVWVTDRNSCKIIKLSQDGQLLQAMQGIKSTNGPIGVSVSPEGQIYVCEYDNHCVTIHDDEGKFQFAVGSQGSGPGCFGGPNGVTFGSDGLVYVTDEENSRICVWSKEGTFQKDFSTKYDPSYIAASGDNHLVITSYPSNTVMVYTFMSLEGMVLSWGSLTDLVVYALLTVDWCM